MNSPNEDPENSHPELAYAPPWARNQLLPLSGHSAGLLPVEQRTRNELVSSENRALSDDIWRPRVLDPEVVPEPSAYGAPNLWPLVLQMGMICAVAAAVAGAAVMLFNARQPAPESAQAKAPPTSIAVSRATPSSVESPQFVPALIHDGLANAAQSLPQATPGPSQVPPGAGPIAAKPPDQVIATAPANQSLSNVQPTPAPLVVNPQLPPVRDASPAAHAAPIPAPALQPAAPAPLHQPVVVLADDEIARLIKRGKDLLKDGDFAAARLLFERAADAGSSEAALALGSTYDPLVIKRLGAVTVMPDAEKARKWYQVAADRGSAAASLQLANLARGR